MSLISPKGLEGAFTVIQRCLQALEVNRRYCATVYCEPQMARRNLYPAVSTAYSGEQARTIMNVLAYADGSKDLLDIADAIGIDVLACAEIAARLQALELLRPA
jgi:aminopeptidase-like protein